MRSLAGSHTDLYWRVATCLLLMLFSKCGTCSRFPCSLFRGGVCDPDPDCLGEIEELLEQVEDGHTCVRRLLSRVCPTGLVTLDKLCESRFLISSLVLDEPMSYEIVLESLGIPPPVVKLMLEDDVEDLYISPRWVQVYRRGGIRELVSLPRTTIRKALDTFVHLAFLSGLDIGPDTPSGLYCIRVGQRTYRVAVDVWPRVEDVLIHVRAHARPFTLAELVELGTLTRELAEIVLRGLSQGFNLLIGGPPGSGKTTLVNAILLELRPSRLVYVDEADELVIENFPVLKYRSLDGRLEEIERVLYRGGGVLVIGELRRADHYQALELAVSSGLQVIATVHCRDLRDLENKLRTYSRVLSTQLRERFIVLILRFVGGKRKVVQYLLPDEFADAYLREKCLKTV